MPTGNPGQRRSTAGRLGSNRNTPELAPIPAALDKACRTFEQEVGGREALIAHLAHARLTDEQQLLVGAIADPRNDRNSLARICSLFEIRFADLLALFRDAGFVRAQLAAMQRVWTKLPDVAEDVMARAVTHTIPCVTCASTGKVPRKEITGKTDTGEPVFTEWEEACGGCGGTGQVTVQPKLETQRTALELGGLISRVGPAVNVNVSQQQGMASGFGSFSDFSSVADRVLYQQATETVIDVEATPITTEPESEAVEEEP